jgi:hypothetical protein
VHCTRRFHLRERFETRCVVTHVNGLFRSLNRVLPVERLTVCGWKEIITDRTRALARLARALKHQEARGMISI